MSVVHHQPLPQPIPRCRQACVRGHKFCVEDLACVVLQSHVAVPFVFGDGKRHLVLAIFHRHWMTAKRELAAVWGFNFFHSPQHAARIPTNFGTFGNLNVGDDDTTLSFDPKSAGERMHSARIVRDRLRCGYALPARHEAQIYGRAAA